MPKPLPEKVSIYDGGPSFVPTCDACGWIGRDYWTRLDAIRAAHAHGRSTTHRENTGPRGVLDKQGRPVCAECYGWGAVPHKERLPAGPLIASDDPPCPRCGGSGVERVSPPTHETRKRD
jgi:hypothetical protein